MPLLRVMAGSRSFGALQAAFILAACVHALCAQFIRAEGHTTLYAVQGLLNTALYIALNVLFLTVFRWGVMGYLLSTVAADCLSALFLICRERLWRQLRPAPRAAPWRQMLAYCVPLIPTAVFWWIMGVSDRYLVKWFVGSDANGIYAVAYKIPTILTILATVFMDAWQLSAIAESGDRRAQARFYARVWDAFFSAVCLCAGGIIAFSPLLIRLLAAESYPVLGHRRDDFDENGPPLRLCGHPARGAHRLFAAVSLCPFSQRCACRGGAGCYDRRAGLLC